MEIAFFMDLQLLREDSADFQVGVLVELVQALSNLSDEPVCLLVVRENKQTPSYPRLLPLTLVWAWMHSLWAVEGLSCTLPCKAGRRGGQPGDTRVGNLLFLTGTLKHPFQAGSLNPPYQRGNQGLSQEEDKRSTHLHRPSAATSAVWGKVLRRAPYIQS